MIDKFLNDKNISIGRLVVTLMMLLIVVVGGTFAWLTYSSRQSALVLTIGNINDTINDTEIKLSPYQIKETMTAVDNYTDGVYSIVNVTKGQKNTSVTLSYKINNLDPEILEEEYGLVYTVTDSSGRVLNFNGSVRTDGKNYTASFHELLEDRLNNLPDEVVIFDTAASTGEYKVYLWVKNLETSQNVFENSTLDVELNGSIGSVTINAIDVDDGGKYIDKYEYGYTLVADVVDSSSTATYTYQWYINDDPNTVGGTPISGATSSTYELTKDEAGKWIYVVVNVIEDHYTARTYVDITDTEIISRDITITADSETKTYNGITLINHGCKVTTGAVISGHTVTCTNTGSIIDAGSVTNSINTVLIEDASGNDITDYYNITKVSGTLNINPASVAVIWNDDDVDVVEFVYNGSEQAPQLTSPINGVTVNNVTEKINITRTGKVNAGVNYESVASCSSVTNGRAKCSNYTLTDTTKKFKINKADISPTISMTGYTYAGTKSTPSVSGNLGNGKVTYYYNTSNSNSGGTAWTSVANSSSLNAGDYYMYAEIKESDNYKAATTSAVKFTIAKAVPTCSAKITGTNTYDQTLTATLTTNSNGTKKYVWYYNTSNSISGGSSLSNTTNQFKINMNLTDLFGKYIYVIAIVEEADNYMANSCSDITDSTNNKTATVSKIDISPTVSMAGYTYNGTKSTPSVSGNTGNGTVTYYYNTKNSNSGGTAWTSVANSSSLNAGDYYMYAVIGETANYKGATTSPVKFTIAKADCSCSISLIPTNMKYPEDKTGTVRYSCTGDGQISVESSNTNVIKVETGTVANESASLTAYSVGNSTITVRRAIGTNYKACSTNKLSNNNDATVVVGANTYTISYYANGGTGTIASHTVDYGKSVTISSNSFEKVGYTFAGWTTNSDGSDDGHGWTGFSGTWSFSNGTKGISNLNLKLYARWTSNTAKITIKKDGSAYSGLTVALYQNGTSIHSSPAYSNGDYTFSEVKLPSSVTSVTSNIYDIYVGGSDTGIDVTINTTTGAGTATINYYTLTLNKGSGVNGKGISSLSGAGTYLSGTNVTISATIATNYAFASWSVSSGATPASTTSASTTVKIDKKTVLVANAKDPTAPTCELIDSTKTGKSTSQTATLSCHDDVGIIAYYWGTKSSPSDSDFTAVSSINDFSATKTVNVTADSNSSDNNFELDTPTYYLVVKDEFNRSSSQNITYVEYLVQDRLLTTTGSKNEFNSVNYVVNSNNIYIVDDNADVSISGVTTIPTGANGYSSSLFGSVSDIPSTGSATTTTSVKITNSSNVLVIWHNRAEYTIKIATGGNGSIKLTGERAVAGITVSQTGVEESLVMRYGETGTVTAIPSTGYTFKDFTGLLSSTTNPLSFTVTNTGTVTANFHDVTSPKAPVISKTDYNTFTYSAKESDVSGNEITSGGSGVVGYFISKTDSKPSAGATSGWVTTTSYDISGAGTYYVWAKDAAGNVSDSANISAYTVTRSVGNGSSLITKYDSIDASAGTAFTSSSLVVLSGTNVWASATASTGYNTAVLKRGDVVVTNPSYASVTGNVTISSLAEPNLVALTVKKDGVYWTGLTVDLYQNNSKKMSYVSYMNNAYAFFPVNNGTYDIYINNNDIGLDVTVLNNKIINTIDYYTLTINKDVGISSVTGAGTYLSGTSVGIGATANTTNGFGFGSWSTSEGSSPASTTSASTTVELTQKTILFANSVDNQAPSVPVITRTDYNTFTFEASDNVDVTGYYVSTSPPTSMTEGWITTTSYDISSAGTYYVWAKDAVGKSSGAASINAYTVNRSQGTGSTLTTRYDSTSNSSGTVFTSNSIVVLAGTNIWASATANVGYNSPTLTWGDDSLTVTGDSFAVNSSNTITSGATAKTYSIKYYAGNGVTTAGATLLGTSYCNFAQACTLNSFSKYSSTFPNSSYGWAFAGWADSTSGIENVYNLDNGTTVNLSDGATIPAKTHYSNITIYAYGRKKFNFYSGINKTLLTNEDGSAIYQYWNPYAANPNYVSAITIPTPVDISGWQFIGYKYDNDNAEAARFYDTDDIGTSVKPALTLPRNFRSLYGRHLTISYNANGGTGTVADTTVSQLFNTGLASTTGNYNVIPVNLASNNFTYTGNIFSKWADGSVGGTQYDAGASYSAWNPAVDSTATTKTMYAIWIPDNVVPNISVTFTSKGSTYSGEWTNDNIIATVNFSDADSGIDVSTFAYRVRSSSGTFSEWYALSNSSTSSNVQTWQQDGDRIGQYRICDIAGNCSTTGEFPIKIDKTAPTATFTATASGTTVTAKYTNVDASVSGVKSYNYAIVNNGETCGGYISHATNTTYSFTNKDYATYTVCGYIEDNAGNILTSTATVTVAPVNVTLTLNANGGYVYLNNYSTATQHTYTAPLNGSYKLQVWGAQGGNANTRVGGYGGYSEGYVTLTKDKIIYINVGGQGEGGDSSVARNGGYNGGGNVPYKSESTRYLAGGGGATHIALSSGLLSSLSSKKSDILIVAGGGGGAFQHGSSTSYYGNGGHGGGYVGVNGGYNPGSSGGYGTGGTQSAGGYAYGASTKGVGGFGYGGNEDGSIMHGSAGGGGYYGGGASRGERLDTGNSGGGGGSGYIGNSLLSNKVMYCYGCTESTATDTKTVTTTNVSDTATANYAKTGNGHARVSIASGTKTVSTGSSYGTLPTPYKTGYNFIGWYDEDGNKVTSNSTPKATNHTLTARWSAGPTCTINATANSTTVTVTSTTDSGVGIKYKGWNSSYTGTQSTEKTITEAGTITYYVKDNNDLTGSCTATITNTSMKCGTGSYYNGACFTYKNPSSYLYNCTYDCTTSYEGNLAVESNVSNCPQIASICAGGAQGTLVSKSVSSFSCPSGYNSNGNNSNPSCWKREADPYPDCGTKIKLSDSYCFN